MIVSPSFLSADFTVLREEILSVNKAKWLHFDVMDGKFVSNTTYDHEMLKRVKEYSTQFFDCHLMIENPHLHIEKYVLAGANLITFHIEAETSNTKETIDQIHDLGALCGISIKPDTDKEELLPYLDQVDLVLIMSVEPGKGGQAFLPNSLDKMKWLKEERDKFQHHYVIEVDGGINHETFQLVKDSGADIAVIGSYLFKNQHRNRLIDTLENDR